MSRQSNEAPLSVFVPWVFQGKWLSMHVCYGCDTVDYSPNYEVSSMGGSGVLIQSEDTEMK